MNRIKIILFFWLAFATGHVYAEGPVLNQPVRKDVHPGVQFLNHKDWNFVENKGQLPPDPLKGETIKYYGHQGGVYLYCQTGKISFVFTKTESKETDKISEATCLPVSNVGVQNPEPLHLKRADKTTTSRPLPAIALATARTDLILLNSNPSAEIISSDQQEYYENYYTTGNADSGITNVHTYKTITYKEIYPHIDMVLHCKPQGMKYEFIVHPGGKTSDIQMQWEGIEKIKKLEDSKIEYSLALGKMDEGKPVSYQGKNIIESDFIMGSNLIGFKVNRYDKTKDLVIDPTLIWGTYFGGKKYDECLGVATDPSGNVYISGWTESSSGVATGGAYQTSLAGNSSAYIAKFDSSGSIKWATYYGGPVGDAAYGMSVDGSGNVYITGTTYSGTGIATNGAYQTSFGGGGVTEDDDAFLAKFNTNGIIQWATFFGGSEADEGQGIANDGFGNVYITGCTQSTSGIATNGAFQTYYSGAPPSKGGFNAFIAKFKSNGAIVWATYFGSTFTRGMGISADGIGNIYCTGYTDSTINITTSGAYQTSFGGGDMDAFLVKFRDDGTQLWATYFGGNGGEIAYNVTSNASGAVYISGETGSSSGIATSGAYQTSLTLTSGGFNIFLASFNDGGGLQWATYYGGTYYLFGAEIAIDVAGNVFFAASTSNLSGIATSGAYLTVNRNASNPTNGTNEAFLAEFNNKGKRLWATYYGGTNWANIAIGAATDAYGNVYLAGYTNSTTYIATNNVYQSTYPGGGQDAFLVKFHNITGSNDAGIDSFVSPTGNYCMDTIPVMVRLENFGVDTLDSVKIFSTINGKFQPPYSWAGKLPTDSTAIINIGNGIFPPGADTIKAWTSRPNGQTDSFPGNDTVTTIIHIYPLPTPNAGPDTLLCYDEVYTMQGSGGVTYTWHPAIYLSSATDPNAKAILPNTENYVLVVRNSIGCSDSAPVLLKVRPKPNVQAFVTNSPVCYGQSTVLYAKGSGGDSLHYSFSWPGDSLNGDSITKKVFATGWHTVILNDNCSPSQAIDSVYVLVSPKLSIKAFALNNPICYGQNVILYAKGSGGDSLHYQYQWVDDGLSGDSVNEKGYQSGWHKVTLTDNCSPASVIDSVYITAISPPKADFISIPGNMVKAKTKISFQNQSSNALAYLWTFGNRDTSTTVSPVYIYTDTGDYKITLVAYGTGPCPNDTAYETIQIIKDQITIYIPSAFTPNGDGINDLFVISGIGISSYSYNIYNRWGEHIYSSPLERPGEAGWDGTFKGQPVPEGVYIYMFDIIDVEGQHHYVNGNVTLMR